MFVGAEGSTPVREDDPGRDVVGIKKDPWRNGKVYVRKTVLEERVDQTST